jgi:hypothetical protein
LVTTPSAARNIRGGTALLKSGSVLDIKSGTRIFVYSNVHS